jgi:hypothetical protein
MARPLLVTADRDPEAEVSIAIVARASDRSMNAG